MSHTDTHTHTHTHICAHSCKEVTFKLTTALHNIACKGHYIFMYSIYVYTWLYMFSVWVIWSSFVLYVTLCKKYTWTLKRDVSHYENLRLVHCFSFVMENCYWLLFRKCYLLTTVWYIGRRKWLNKAVNLEQNWEHWTKRKRGLFSLQTFWIKGEIPL